jgi:hypothetical protein
VKAGREKVVFCPLLKGRAATRRGAQTRSRSTWVRHVAAILLECQLSPASPLKKTYEDKERLSFKMITWGWEILNKKIYRMLSLVENILLLFKVTSIVTCMDTLRGYYCISAKSVGQNC